MITSSALLGAPQADEIESEGISNLGHDCWYWLAEFCIPRCMGGCVPSCSDPPSCLGVPSKPGACKPPRAPGAPCCIPKNCPVCITGCCCPRRGFRPLQPRPPPKQPFMAAHGPRLGVGAPAGIPSPGRGNTGNAPPPPACQGCCNCCCGCCADGGWATGSSMCCCCCCCCCCQGSRCRPPFHDDDACNPLARPGDVDLHLLPLSAGAWPLSPNSELPPPRPKCPDVRRADCMEGAWLPLLTAPQPP